MNERLRILKMLEEGKINKEEASKLLDALGEEKGLHKKPGWLKVRVYENDKTKVKVNIPLSVIKLGIKLGGAFQFGIPEHARKKMEEKGIKLDKEGFKEIEKIYESLTEQGPFKLVDVEDDESGEKVEVYIE